MSGKARARLAAVGLVLLGFSLGVLADHLWLAHRMRTSIPEPTHEASMIAMLNSLDLAEEQHKAIDAIFQRYHTKVQRHLDVVHPVLLSTMDSARHEIEALLDPDQLREFHLWIRAERERLGTSQPTLIRH